MFNLVSALKPVLPNVLWRHRWQEYQNKYGVPFARGTMQNKDSEGRGPKADRLGGKIYYLKEDYLQWLESQGSTEGEGYDN